MYRQTRSSAQREDREDDPALPGGECRYILLHPEVKGQRCACVGFSLNRSTPGSSCDCGHQACYHLAVREGSASESEEVVALKSRIAHLEELLVWERGAGGITGLVSRLSQLEELVDKNKTDLGSEIKGAYRGIEGLWHNVGKLQKATQNYDERIDLLSDTTQGTQDDMKVLQSRLIDVDDATMRLEDQMDNLAAALETPSLSRAGSVEDKRWSGTGATTQSQLPTPRSSVSSPAGSWIVHVSLLPKASQPFPFENDTVAYRRCLSRGLHRIVTIKPDCSSASFIESISIEFVDLLKGRPWMPLVAKLCDAKTLRGLPMLRQLPESEIKSQMWDLNFLKANCATLDQNGNVLDLYIAMISHTLSWPQIRAAKPFVAGHESCWDYDPVLDGAHIEIDDSDPTAEQFDEVVIGDDRISTLSAGDIVRAYSPPTIRRKRDMTAISRATSFGSTEGEPKRAKIQQRQFPAASVENLSRRAEAV